MRQFPWQAMSSGVTVDEVRAKIAVLERKHERRRAAVAKDLLRIEEAPRLLYETELLKSARARPFDTFAEVVDYATDPPATIRIALEPGRPLQEQVQRRFRLARRLQAAEAKALERLEMIEAEGKKLAGVAREIETIAERGGSDAAIAAFMAAHADLFGASGQTPRKKGEPLPSELPYREYVSASGRAIWVGKSSKKNDVMTFKHASPHAQWLHVSGYAGTHVIVPKKRDEALDAATLSDAALLAAHFSKAPDGAVEVSVTEVKFVRKVRGANAGQVKIERERHVIVNKDPAAAKVIEQRRPVL